MPIERKGDGRLKIREAVWLALMTVGGVASAAVTLYGMYSAYAVDFRQNTVLTILFCLLPFLCFPVFMLVGPARRSIVLQSVIDPAYLAVYSMLDWRTCAELGYCGSAISTVLETLRTPQVLACFAAALFSLAALLVDRKGPTQSVRKN